MSPPTAKSVDTLIKWDFPSHELKAGTAEGWNLKQPFPTVRFKARIPLNISHRDVQCPVVVFSIEKK